MRGRPAVRCVACRGVAEPWSDSTAYRFVAPPSPPAPAYATPGTTTRGRATPGASGRPAPATRAVSLDALDFCAIDFETANPFRGSPCSVGMARIRGGRVVETWSTLMRPPKGYDDFHLMNVEIHGITRKQVRGKPRFRDVIGDILDFAAGMTLVAHNGTFDTGVIRDACTSSGLEWPSLAYACTFVLSRRTWELDDYTLPTVSTHVGRPVTDHHEATADAIASAEIMVGLARHYGARTVAGVVDLAGYRMGLVRPGEWNGCTKR